MVHLTYEDRLLIVAAAISLVLFTIIFMACKLIPCCLLYKYCPFRRKFIDEDDERRRRPIIGKKQLLRYVGPTFPTLNPQGLPNGKTKVGSIKEREHPPAAKMPLVDEQLSAFVGKPPSRNSLSSTTSVSSSIHSGNEDASPPCLRRHILQRSMADNNAQLSAVLEKPEPTIDFGISFDKDRSKIIVFVKSAKNIPLSLYGTANDCRAHVYIIKDMKRRWRRRSQISLDDMREFKTQLARRSTSPVFSEQFMADLHEREQKYCTVKLVLTSYDRFAHETVVGEVHVPASRLADGEMQSFSAPLKELTRDMGQILIALTYLPTAERLCLLVLRAANLRPVDGQKTASPYIRASLIHRSRVMEKLKTPVQANTLNPTFNETLSFDLPKGEVDRVTLILTVQHDCHAGPQPEMVLEPDEKTFKSSSFKSPRRKSASNILELATITGLKTDGVSIHKSRSTNSVRAKPVILGQLALGAGCRDLGQAHWREMTRNPRKQFSQWHKLVQ